MSEIYQPAEDSYLLAQTLEKKIKNKNIKVLDMGSGSGIQAQALINIGIDPQDIVLADINEEAINYLKQKFPISKVIKSNLFSNIKDKYDLIIFNPPYLPDHKFDKGKDTSGGKKGSGIINKFLKQAHKCLNNNKEIFLLTSSLTKDINWQGYNKKIISRKKLFFEELYIYKLWEKKK